jgi:hypothetical protein
MATQAPPVITQRVHSSWTTSKMKYRTIILSRLDRNITGNTNSLAKYRAILTAYGPPGLTNLSRACPKWHAAVTTVPIFFLFILPDHRLNIVKLCMYIYRYLTPYRLYMNYRCYQTTRQWNIFTQIWAVRNVDWIFIVGAPEWRWLGEYVTLDRTFCRLFLKLQIAPATVTAKFAFLTTFLEEAFIRNILIFICINYTI